MSTFPNKNFIIKIMKCTQFHSWTGEVRYSYKKNVDFDFGGKYSSNFEPSKLLKKTGEKNKNSIEKWLNKSVDRWSK